MSSTDATEELPSGVILCDTSDRARRDGASLTLHWCASDLGNVGACETVLRRPTLVNQESYNWGATNLPHGQKWCEACLDKCRKNVAAARRRVRRLDPEMQFPELPASTIKRKMRPSSGTPDGRSMSEWIEDYLRSHPRLRSGLVVAEMTEIGVKATKTLVETVRRRLVKNGVIS